MAKAQRVLSIEIGYSLTQVCEMDYNSKHPKVYGVFSMKTPMGIQNDGFITPTDEFIRELKSYVATNGMQAKKVIFVVSSTKIANREAMLPAVKENKIKEMVMSNVTDYFPVDPSMYQFAHTIMNTVTDSEGNKQHHMMLMASPAEMLEGYADLARALGLELDSIDYSGNSIFQALKHKYATGVNLVVKIDERSSLITVTNNSVITMQRAGVYGADQIVEPLMETDLYGEKLTYEAAVKTLRRNNLVMRTEEEALAQRERETEAVLKEQEAILQKASTKGDNIAAAAATVASKQADANLKMLRLRKDVTYAYQQLISSIVRVIDYYNSKNREAPIDKIVITGIAADFWGFSNVLAAELGREVEVLRDLAGTNISQGLHLQDVSLGDYISVIGAALQSAGFIPASMEIEAKKAKTAKGLTIGGAKIDKNQAPFIVFISGAALAVILLFASGLPYVMANMEQDSLTAKKKQLSYIEPIYKTYQQVETDFQYLSSVYAKTESVNRELHDLFVNMEQKLPTNIQMLSINVDDAKVTLGLRVPNKRTIAKTVLQLRSFECFSDIYIDSIELVEKEVGTSKVAEVETSIVCTYGVNPDLAEPEDTAVETDAAETVE